MAGALAPPVSLCINVASGAVWLEETFDGMAVERPLRGASVPRSSVLRNLIDAHGADGELKVPFELPVADVLAWDQFVADEYHKPENPPPSELARWLKVRNSRPQERPCFVSWRLFRSHASSLAGDWHD